jgi:hypothetical protein
LNFFGLIECLLLNFLDGQFLDMDLQSTPGTGWRGIRRQG